MQVVALDILGPLPESDSGNRYILVAGDYFTKWFEAYAIPNQEAKTVAEKLVNDLLSSVCVLIRSCHIYFALLCYVVTLLCLLYFGLFKFCILLFMIYFLLS